MTHTDNVDLNAKLAEWETFYNYNRPHGAFAGRTPYETLKRLLGQARKRLIRSGMSHLLALARFLRKVHRAQAAVFLHQPGAFLFLDAFT